MRLYIMTDFKNRYRVESCRLKGWDYSAAGYYFVTICVQDRKCCLGEVVNGVMRLSPVGIIITEEWQNTATLRENVTLDESIVMPNHIHGVVCINGPARREQQTIPPLQYSNSFGPQKNNLSSMIRGFKGASTKRIHLDGHHFAWQSGFYEEVIRDERMLDNARQYIRNNPVKWDMDHDNPTNRR